jgi:hypothetical protein
LTVWQDVVQPAASGMSALAAAAMGLMFIVARRQHAREKAEMHASAKAAPASQPEETPVAGKNHE